MMAKKESHSKGNNLEYQKLEMQEYFLTLNPSLAKFYFLIRSRMLYCKYNYKNQYIRKVTDNESIREKLLCPACKVEHDEPLHWTTCKATSTDQINCDKLFTESDTKELKCLLERLHRLWKKREEMVEKNDNTSINTP